jgi:hypothetical protein
MVWWEKVRAGGGGDKWEERAVFYKPNQARKKNLKVAEGIAYMTTSEPVLTKERYG